MLQFHQHNRLTYTHLHQMKINVRSIYTFCQMNTPIYVIIVWWRPQLQACSLSYQPRSRGEICVSWQNPPSSRFMRTEMRALMSVQFWTLMWEKFSPPPRRCCTPSPSPPAWRWHWRGPQLSHHRHSPEKFWCGRIGGNLDKGHWVLDCYVGENRV